jgi:import inner membrane translocase subunit TIM44
MSAKILENDVHVFVVSWRTQEVLAYRDLKTNEVTVGDENKIQQVGYVAVLTRVEEELDNPETGGWKVIDVRSFFAFFLFISHFRLKPPSPDRR